MTKTPASRDKVIFIDRDGVINWDPIGDYIKHWKHFRFLPGVIPALKKLSDKKFKIVIISNQAGIGDGVYPESALEDITLKMLYALEKKKVRIDALYFCLHGKKHGCNCRKPKTQMFKIASEKLSYDKKKTFYIGDKHSDVEAGKRFGLKTIMVLTGHGVHDLPKLKKPYYPNYIVPTIKEAAAIALKQ